MLQDLEVVESLGNYFSVKVTANGSTYMAYMSTNELRKKQLEMQAEKVGVLSLVHEYGTLCFDKGWQSGAESQGKDFQD